jgi:glycerol uptake facilitator
MEAQPVGELVVEDVVDTYVDRGPAAYAAEFLGTFALVFFITMVVTLYVTVPVAGAPQPFIDWSVIGSGVMGERLAGGNIAVALLANTIATGAGLVALILTFGPISGAHFNPAVTLGLAAIRQIRLPEAAVYIVLQVAGGIAGALLTKALLTDEGAAVNYGAPAISERLSDKVFLGALCEGIGTFFLVWAIVGVAVNPAGLKDWAGLAIGTTLGFLVMIFGPLTGAGLNPARSFGPALVGHAFDGAGRFTVVYVLAPVIGGIVAALLYTYLFTTPGKKGLRGMEPVG